MYIEDLDETYSRLVYSENELPTVQKIIDNLSPYTENYQFNVQYKAGIWDGKQYFFKIEDDNFLIPKGLSKRVSKTFDLEYKEREDNLKFNSNELSEFIDTLNLPFKPYEYQFNGVLEMLNDKRMVAIFATGSGKSLIAYIFLRFLISRGYKALLLVPDVGLVEQMYNDFKNYGFDNIDEHTNKIYSGQDKDLSKPIVISTFQSMINLTNHPYLSDLDCIFIDEAHGLNDIENSMGKITEKTKRAKWKIGVTGTLPPSETSRMSLYSFLGSLEFKVRPIDLIKMGRATPVQIMLIYLLHDKKHSYAKMRKSSAKGKYQKEVKYLIDDVVRNKTVIKIADNVSTQHGNSILLYDRIEHGFLLLKLAIKERFEDLRSVPLDDIEIQLKPTKKFTSTKKVVLYQNHFKGLKPPDNWYCINDFDIFFIKGEVPGKERLKISGILETKDKAILIANFKTTSTGVSIKNIHNIIFGINTKGFIRVSQSIGRGMRLNDNKSKVNIIDIVDDIDGKNYALTHSEVRINDVYLFNGYPMNEVEHKLKQEVNNAKSTIKNDFH